MLNCSASLAMSTSILKALPGKLDIKRHSLSILYKDFLFKLGGAEKYEQFWQRSLWWGPFVPNYFIFRQQEKSSQMTHNDRSQ